MDHYYWNDWYLGWGWVLWFGFIFLMFSSFGNWGYTYRAHQKVAGRPENKAFDILDERYAWGEIDRIQYGQLKADIVSSSGLGSAGTRPIPGSAGTRPIPVTSM